MDSKQLNDFVEKPFDVNITNIKHMVDEYIVIYQMVYDVDRRNQSIYDIYHIIQKQYVAKNYTHFEEHKLSIIRQVVGSYLASKRIDQLKNLDISE